MKYIKTFEQFINEDEDINEGVSFSAVKSLAKEFINGTSKFKVSDSRIVKSKIPTYVGMKKTKKTGYHVQVVVPEKNVEGIREYIKKFKEEYKEDIENTGLSFNVSGEIKDKKQLWPVDNKQFFAI